MRDAPLQPPALVRTPGAAVGGQPPRPPAQQSEGHFAGVAGGCGLFSRLRVLRPHSGGSKPVCTLPSSSSSSGQRGFQTLGLFAVRPRLLALSLHLCPCG